MMAEQGDVWMLTKAEIEAVWVRSSKYPDLLFFGEDIAEAEARKFIKYLMEPCQERPELRHRFRCSYCMEQLRKEVGLDG